MLRNFLEPGHIKCATESECDCECDTVSVSVRVSGSVPVSMTQHLARQCGSEANDTVEQRKICQFFVWVNMKLLSLSGKLVKKLTRTQRKFIWSYLKIGILTKHFWSSLCSSESRLSNLSFSLFLPAETVWRCSPLPEQHQVLLLQWWRLQFQLRPGQGGRGQLSGNQVHNYMQARSQQFSPL